MLAMEISQKLQEINAGFLDNIQSREIIYGKINYFKNFQRGFTKLFAAGIHEIYGFKLIQNIEYSLELGFALAKFHELDLLKQYKKVIVDNPQYAIELCIAVETLHKSQLSHYIYSVISLPLGQNAQYAAALAELQGEGLLHTYISDIQLNAEYALEIVNALTYLVKNRLDNYKHLILQDPKNSAKTKSSIKALKSLGLLNSINIQKLKKFNNVPWQEFHNMLEIIAVSLETAIIKEKNKYLQKILEDLISNSETHQTIIMIGNLNRNLLNINNLITIVRMTKIQAQFVRLGLGMLLRMGSEYINQDNLLVLMDFTNIVENIAVKKLSDNLDNVINDGLKIYKMYGFLKLLKDVEEKGFISLWEDLRCEVLDVFIGKLKICSELSSNNMSRFIEFIDNAKYVPTTSLLRFSMVFESIFKHIRGLEKLVFSLEDIISFKIYLYLVSASAPQTARELHLLTSWLLRINVVGSSGIYPLIKKDVVKKISGHVYKNISGKDIENFFDEYGLQTKEMETSSVKNVIVSSKGYNRYMVGLSKTTICHGMHEVQDDRLIVYSPLMLTA